VLLTTYNHLLQRKYRLTWSVSPIDLLLVFLPQTSMCVHVGAVSYPTTHHPPLPSLKSGDVHVCPLSLSNLTPMNGHPAHYLKVAQRMVLHADNATSLISCLCETAVCHADVSCSTSTSAFPPLIPVLSPSLLCTLPYTSHSYCNHTHFPHCNFVVTLF
jgi:hypothetical protein